MTTPSVPQMSPPTSLTVRAEHLITPAGHRLNSWAIVDGATVVATMKDLGPGTEALAYKLAASLDLLAGLKKAKETIQAWHSIQELRRGVPDSAWDIYDKESPEMRVINAALARAEGR